MRTLSALLVALSSFIVIAACASSASNTPLTIKVEQLPDAGFNVENQGALSVAYQMTVHNGTSEPLTLKKIEMRTDARSPYTLRNEPVEMNETIAAGAEATIPFTMWKLNRSQRSTARGTVLVTGTAYFDSQAGAMAKAFTQSFVEP